MTRILTILFSLLCLTARAERVTLAWDASPGADRYGVAWGPSERMQRSVEATTPACSVFVLAGRQYWFRVRAGNAQGWSAFSQPLTLSTK